MNDLMARLSDAIQRQHELIVELQTIKDEFNSTINHIKAETDRLQSKYEYAKEILPSQVVNLPRAATDLLDEEFHIPPSIRPAKRDQPY